MLGYIFITGATPAEDFVTRLGKKRATLLPKLYSLRDEGKIRQTRDSSDWRARPYDLTDAGRRDVQRYHLDDAVRAYLEDSARLRSLKQEESRRLLEAVKPQAEGRSLESMPLVFSRQKGLKRPISRKQKHKDEKN